MAEQERQWELRVSVLQSLAEVDRGLEIAQAELRAGKFLQARETLGVTRALLPMAERLVQELHGELRSG